MKGVKSMRYLIPAIMIFIFIPTSMAAECVMKIKREACPSKSADAYKPYNGQVETEEVRDVESFKECEQAAHRASIIVRKQIIAAKTVTAHFDGKSLEKAFSTKAKCH